MTNTWKAVLALVGLMVAWVVSFMFGSGFSVLFITFVAFPLVLLWLAIRTIRHAWTGK